MGQTVRSHSQLNHRVLDLSVAADMTEWLSYLVPAYDLGANGWVDGQELRDTFTGTILRVQETPGVGLFWTGGNCTLRTAAAGVGGALPYRYVVLSGANVATRAGAGDAYNGIVLHTALETERVYVLEIGRMLVVQGASPPAIGEQSASSATASTAAGAPPDQTSGFVDRTPVTVAAVDYDLVTLAGLSGPVWGSGTVVAAGALAGPITITPTTGTVVIT